MKTYNATKGEQMLTSYETIALPYYTDHVLKERAVSAINDFRKVHYTLTPPNKRSDVIETFLKAFIARAAEKRGTPVNLFGLSEEQVVFTDWRTGKTHSARFYALDKFQKVHALQIFCEAVPEPAWKRK